MSHFAESVVEDAALAWFESLGYAVLHGPDISPGGDTLTLALSQREREHYSDVVLDRRLRQALVHLNPDLPAEALDDAFRKLTLAALRDTLLPKLISGELRIKDAGRIIGRHV